MNGFIIDLDGTLHRGREPIPYAGTFIRMLRSEGLPFLLVTNNSSRTPEQVAIHLSGVGIEVAPEHIYTSSQAAAQYLLELRRPGSIYAIGETGLTTALTQSGFELTEGTPDFVVQGIDRGFSYEKLALAVRHIRNGAAYVLTNPDLLLPSDGGLVPGAGAIAASIRAASGAEPTVIGKPSPIIMGYAIRKLGLPPGDVWVIGDNPATDIRGGAMAGCLTAVVLTGVAQPGLVQEQLTQAGIRADLICGDLRDFARETMPKTAKAYFSAKS